MKCLKFWVNKKILQSKFCTQTKLNRCKCNGVTKQAHNLFYQGSIHYSIYMDREKTTEFGI